MQHLALRQSIGGKAIKVSSAGKEIPVRSSSQVTSLAEAAVA